MKWTTDLPDKPVIALITRKRWSFAHGWERYIDFGSVMPDAKANNNIVAYMVIQHVADNPAGWRSPYNGTGEWPKKDGMYISCFLPEYETIPGGRDIYIRYSWFDSNKETFGGREMLAWMPAPKVYAGEKEME